MRQTILTLIVALHTLAAAGQAQVNPPPSILDSQHDETEKNIPADTVAQSGSVLQSLLVGDSSPAVAEECWPKWYAQAESIFLWRDNSAHGEEASFTYQSDASGIDFDAGIGPLATIGVRVNANSGWEGRYFSSLDMVGTGTVLRTIALMSLIPSTPDPALLQVNRPFSFIRYTTPLTYQSDLHSAEINYVHSWDEISLLGGFRYLRLTEDLNEPAYEGSTSHSENDLFGGQLGMRWSSAYQRISWDATGRAGVFGNDAHQSQSYHVGSQTAFAPTWYDSRLAFVGDINLSLNFRISSIWSIRSGYNLMWIDRVALAPDQRLAFQNGKVATDGSVFLQGVNVGLEGRW